LRIKQGKDVSPAVMMMQPSVSNKKQANWHQAPYQLTASFSMTGRGLIHNEPVSFRVEPAPVGQGICFVWPSGVICPAEVSGILDAAHGVTLQSPCQQKTLSIVEHALGAFCLAGVWNATLYFETDTVRELPLLDGSAGPWLKALSQHRQPLPLKPHSSNREARLVYSGPEQEMTLPHRSGSITVKPLDASDQASSLTYCLEGSHPELAQQAVSLFWQAGDLASFEKAFEKSGKARTFGFTADLPALQAKGLAKGVTAENTLGLNADGSCTSPLRFAQEPVYHKMLDFVGDLFLCGIPLSHLAAHIKATQAGHDLHLAFGKPLAQTVF
jgi:UDP-3-O-[3-hydroxymyristoyl] N-acetylglucosamine deacetylase